MINNYILLNKSNKVKKYCIILFNKNLNTGKMFIKINHKKNRIKEYLLEDLVKDVQCLYYML
jgi:hypothetical protein